MPGRGPAPKPADQRARRNKDPMPLRVIEAETSPQPQLPGHEDHWHPQTRRWWQMWAESPLAAEFTANDWSELLDTAKIHDAFWNGDMKMAAELRLRVANFGATPADRARLRITFAQADKADEERGTRASAGTATARERYSSLRLAE